MIPAFEGLFNCLINVNIRSHLNTVFVPYSKTTLARQVQENVKNKMLTLT